MKRRSFLGFLGGGAVAGPSVAKEALSQITPTKAISAFGVGPPVGYMGHSASADSPVMPHQRVGYLRRMLGGAFTEEEALNESDRRDVRWTTISLEAASLRSMSETARYRMIKDRQFHYDQETRRKWWKFELDKLLKDNIW